jgi:hypothetical protein
MAVKASDRRQDDSGTVVTWTGVALSYQDRVYCDDESAVRRQMDEVRLIRATASVEGEEILVTMSNMNIKEAPPKIAAVKLRYVPSNAGRGYDVVLEAKACLNVPILFSIETTLNVPTPISIWVS